MEPNFAKIAVLKAASIIDIRTLDRWKDGGREVVLPYRWSGGPRVLEAVGIPRVVEDEEFTTYLRIVSNSECVVYIDGVPYHSYVKTLDGSIEEMPLPSSMRSLSILVLGRDVNGLGRRLGEVVLEKVLVLTRSRSIYNLALMLEVLYELWKNTKLDDLRRELEELIDEALRISHVESLDVYQLEEAARYMENYDYFQWYNTIRSLEEVPHHGLEYAGLRKPDHRTLIARARKALLYIDEELKKLVERYGKRGSIHAVATTHLDLLWLWNEEVFRYKLGSSMATLLLYTKRYRHTVAAITSTHYLYLVKELYPELFEEMKRCFEENRCVSLGGFWTEFDANLIDGESLARQFLYGQRMLKMLVGRTAKISFLPDTFGFPPSLPQILRKSGIEMFIVRKLSWNEVNVFPYKHFVWIGIDGTTIPTLFVDHYAASLPVSVKDVERVFGGVEKYIDRIVYPYGFGDGGGGPSEETILKLDAISKLPTTPRVIHGELEKIVDVMKQNISKLPRWYGELYLENHRGVYSTGVRLKDMIWRTIKLLKTIDAVLVMAKLMNINISNLKHRAVELWLRALSYQFHDVVASTLSRDALLDVLKNLGKIYADGLALLREALNRLGRVLTNGIAIINPHPWRYRALVEIEIPKDYLCVELNGDVLPCQTIYEDSEHRKILVDVELPSLGIAVLKPVKHVRPIESDVVARCDDELCILENSVLRVAIDRRSGELVSVFDKEVGREVLKDRSNKLVVCEDRPRHWEGWNVDADHVEDCFMLETRSVDLDIVGPLRSCIKIVKKFRNSTLVQRICIDRGSRTVWFFTDVDWRERQHLLKVWFYPDILSHEVWFETSFGAFPRPRHRNTSWDQAKFEVWTLRWVDISEKGYGVTIYTFNTHGVYPDIEGIALTLLRSPVSPSIQDVGHVRIVYALYPHRGDWRDAKVQHMVRELDEKPIAVYINGGGSSSWLELLRVEGEAVVENVKLCEDGDCVVLRIFEGYGGRTKASITPAPGIGIAKCTEMTIVEDVVSETPCTIELKPYEIKTIAVEFNRSKDRLGMD